MNSNRNEKLSLIHSHPVWLSQTLTWLYSQVSEFQKMSIETHVVCNKKTNLGQFQVNNIHCLCDESLLFRIRERLLSKFKLYGLKTYLTSVGKGTKVNIVHSHFGNNAWTNLSEVKKLKAKHVVTFYGLDVNKIPQKIIWKKRYLELFKQVDLVLCEGPHMRDVIAGLGCPKEKLNVQNLGVDIQKIEFKPRVKKYDEKIKFLIASTFREKKGIPIAIEMLGRLHEDVDFELTIVGGATDEKRSIIEEQKIISEIKKYNLINNVKFEGFLSHSKLIRKAYDCHIFLAPSLEASDGDTEGGAPVIILEMMATGMPVISTNHCDIPEIMKPGKDRFLATEGDVESLLNVTKKCIEEWDKLNDTLERLREHVEVNYDIKKQTESISSLYKELLNVE